MKVGLEAGAEWRVLLSAALIGSGVGLGLGAAYMAGGMAKTAADHSRAARIAQAAGGRFTESVLRRETARMDPGVIRLAQAHDPFVGRAPRQAELITARLERASRTEEPARGARDAARELECLAQAVYFEARGESVRGQQAVAQVVLNRVKHPSFPDTVCAVVFQGAGRTVCQFSFACDGSMRRAREEAAWTRARKVAARALAGAVLPEVGKATHFHTLAVSPAWGPRMRQVAQVGMHVFYRFNPRGQAPVEAPQVQPDRAVFTALAPAQPVTPELRLASAVVEKTADATIAAMGLTPALDVKVLQPAPVQTRPVQPRPADANPPAAAPAPTAKPAAGLAKAAAAPKPPLAGSVADD